MGHDPTREGQLWASLRAAHLFGLSAVRVTVIPNRTNCHGHDIRLVSHFIGAN